MSEITMCCCDICGGEIPYPPKSDNGTCRLYLFNHYELHECGGVRFTMPRSKVDVCEYCYGKVKSLLKLSC